MDLFGAEIPKFTLGGHKSVQTLFGGLVSFCIVYVTFLFAVMKLQHMIIKKNPTINFSVDEEAMTEGDRFDTQEDQEKRADPDSLSWVSLHK